MAVKRYNGTSWDVVAGVGPQGAAATSSSIATWVKTAVGGETSVSGNDDNSQPLSYTVGQELVFINGALQKRGADYTATTGNSITGLTALAANDVVTVWTVNAFSVTNAISNTLVDAKGDLIVATGADTPGRLAVGSNDTVLTADSTTGTGLKWAAAPSVGANWTLLNAGGTSLNGAATITVSGISAKDKIMVIVDGVSNVNNYSAATVRFNSDSGNNYYCYGVYFYIDGTYSADISAQTNATLSSIELCGAGNNNTGVGAGYCLITGCNSSGVKVFTSAGGYSKGGNNGQKQSILGGYYNSSSTISSVSIVSNSGNFDAGTVFVYTSA